MAFIIADFRIRIAVLKARSQEPASRIENEKSKSEYLFSTGYWILCLFFLAPDTLAFEVGSGPAPYLWARLFLGTFLARVVLRVAG
jgi:hypothetical protein